MTYSLGGTDAASFSIVPSTGQLRTRAVLDYETKNRYSVTVTASDGRCTDSISVVTINVGDVDEPPLAPDAPTVTATSGSSTSLDVSWTAPANAGKPPITGYDLQYRQEGTTGDFQNGPQNVAGAGMAIPNLQPGALYQVQVRATNAEGDGSYSLPGSGRTNTPPPAPTDPRINGHFVGGKVTLRWKPVSGEASYEVRYVAVTCRDGGCTPDSVGAGPGGRPGRPDWRIPTNVEVTDQTIDENVVVKQATFSGLVPFPCYIIGD